ncbi:MAG: PKD domain-containing protein, partial [Bacteroidales bacterium]|nr:PKD domain-containing protein [Bacteroidales bacterium]
MKKNSNTTIFNLMILTMAMAIIILLPLNAFPSRSIPVALFDAGDTLIAKHESVQFTDQSTGNPDTWVWTFEGGVPATSTDQNPIVVYPTPGVYDVTLTVSNASGSDALSQTDFITVTEYPDEWSYTITGTTHIISVWGGDYPIINGDSLQPGDLVGVFFTDNNDTICGGFNEWDGENNISVVAFGDDSFTSEKDGFAIAEEFIWKVYSWCAQKNFNATATYLSGFSFFVPNELSVLSALEAAGPIYYSISGEITNSLGVELADVFLDFGDNVGPTITDENGYYQRGVPSGWSDTVQPSLQGFGFTPEYRDYSNVLSHIENQDYTASSGSLSISGFVSENAIPLSGVVIHFSNGIDSVITDINGTYAQTVPYGWSGTTTPGKEGYSFSPSSKNYANITADHPNQDFTATLNMYSISGTVTDGTDPLLNVKISFSNNIDSVYTDVSGNYSQSVPYDWSGSTTPSMDGYTFIPVSRSYSNVTSGQTNQDFTGSIQFWIISGTITDGTNPLIGVEISFTNGIDPVNTDVNGFYSQSVP